MGDTRGATRGRELGQLLLVLACVAVPLLAGQQVPAAVTEDLGTTGEVPNATGLAADPEQSPEGAFRWGGRRVSFALQALGDPLDVRLHVSGARPAAAPAAQVGTEAGGRSLGTQEVPRQSADLTYRLPLPALVSINPQLTLTSTLFQPPNDKRKLGIVFYRLDTRNGPGPSLPAPWPAGVLLASGALAYAAVRAVTRRVRPALLAAGAWGLALGLLNALARPWLVFYCLDVAVVPVIALLLVPWGRGTRQCRHQPPPAVPPAPDITAQPWPLAAAMTALAVAVLGWHLLAQPSAAASDATDNWTWGVAFYGALPWPLQAAGVAVVLGALGWAGRGPRPAPTGGPAAIRPGPPRARTWTPFALVAAGLAVFSLLPVRYGEGDRVEFDTKIVAGDVWRERELLDFYLKAKLWRLLRPTFALPSQLYAVTDTLAGGVYLAAAWLLGRALGRTPGETWLLVAALAAVGNILLFFGYVESYSLVAVAGLFVLWACWQYAQGRLSFGSVGALATLAPLLHGSAIWWGPMVLAAWLVRARRQPRPARWRRALAEGAEGVATGLALVLTVLSLMIVDGYSLGRLQEGLGSMGGRDAHTMMQVFRPETVLEHYAFFSWANLGAVIQEQLLTAPLALGTIVLVCVLAGPGVRRLTRMVPALAVLAVGAAGMFFYSITWNPDLGPRNDWDLLSQAAYPLTLLAVYLLLHLPAGRARRLALTAYLSVSAVHAAAWVALHALGIHA